MPSAPPGLPEQEKTAGWLSVERPEHALFAGSGAEVNSRRVTVGPGDDATTVTATQLREVVEGLQQAGQRKPGDADILIVFDAGYDGPAWRSCWQICPWRCWAGSAQIVCSPPPPRAPSATSTQRHEHPAPRAPSATGRPSKHGPEFALAQTATQPQSQTDAITLTDTSRYGTAQACAWNRLHPRLTHRAARESHEGPLPIIEGSIIRLQVDRLPGNRSPKPVWLWYSRPEVNFDLNCLWRAFLRRFDLERTFPKQTLGWTRPRIRTPDQGNRWTWIIVAAHTQLRLARHLTRDLRRPWEKPATEPHRLTPARIRRNVKTG